MTIDYKIRKEKLIYDINRDAPKISALWAGKIDKYEYLTGKEVLPFDQRRVLEQTKFTSSALAKHLKIKNKNNKFLKNLLMKGCGK